MNWQDNKEINNNHSVFSELEEIMEKAKSERNFLADPFTTKWLEPFIKNCFILDWIEENKDFKYRYIGKNIILDHYYNATDSFILGDKINKGRLEAVQQHKKIINEKSISLWNGTHTQGNKAKRCDQLTFPMVKNHIATSTLTYVIHS